MMLVFYPVGSVGTEASLKNDTPPEFYEYHSTMALGQ